MSGNAEHTDGDVAVDRRVRRTTHALRHAMLELVVEKGYERMTVADVIERADVGRSTFYSHYRDKEDLFLSGIEREIRAAFEASAGDDSRSGWLFRHAREHLDLYRALVRRRGGWELVRRRMEDTLVEIFEARLAGVPEHGVPPAAGARFVASSLLGLLSWWLADGARTEPEEIDAAFRALVDRGLEGSFGIAV